MEKEPKIHMPSPSFWPIVLAAGFLLVSLGVVTSIIISIVGILVVLTAIAGWALENRSEGGHHE
jgi:cytochrome c oxidase subunit 1